MLLYGKPVAAQLQVQVKQRVIDHNMEGKYIAFFLLSDNKASQVYVEKKCEFASQIWLHGQVFGRADRNVDETLEMISKCNRDNNCIGIVIQLPLAEQLLQDKAKILSSVAPHKDLDWLGGTLFGLSAIGKINFVPATPKAVLEVMKFYHIDQVEWKTISILWQSDLIWKPLSLELMKRGATVLTFNQYSDQELMRETCRHSGYIISATGVTHLVNEDFVNDSWTQYIIDIGRGVENGKAVGDTDRTVLEDQVAWITPVPGWIWPVTVACLFHNLIALHQIKDLL